MFVDWAGATIPIYDRETGAAQPASLFVAVLGASSYAFARATLSQDLSNWIECHVLAFEFFQGTSKLIVPDNPRTGVTRALEELEGQDVTLDPVGKILAECGSRKGVGTGA